MFEPREAVGPSSAGREPQQGEKGSDAKVSERYQRVVLVLHLIQQVACTGGKRRQY